MIIGTYQLMLRCCNHVVCGACANYMGEDVNECKAKASRAGWFFFLKKTDRGSLEECKCKGCKVLGK